MSTLSFEQRLDGKCVLVRVCECKCAEREREREREGERGRANFKGGWFHSGKGRFLSKTQKPATESFIPLRFHFHSSKNFSERKSFLNPKQTNFRDRSGPMRGVGIADFLEIR